MKPRLIGGGNNDPDSWNVRNGQLAYGCGPNVIVAELDTLRTARFLQLKFGDVTAVRFLSNGDLVVGTCEGMLLLFKAEGGQPAARLGFDSSITHISVADGMILISLAMGGSYAIEAREDTLVRVEYEMPEFRAVSNCVFSIGGSYVLGFGRPDGYLVLRVLHSESEVVLPGSSWAMHIAMCAEEDGSFLIAAGYQDHTIRVWRASQEFNSVISKYATGLALVSIIQTPDGREYSVQIMAKLEGHTGWVNYIDFCGTTICSASFDGQVLVWQLQDNNDYDIIFRGGSTAVHDDQSGFVGCQLISEREHIALSRNGGFSRWVDGESVPCVTGHLDVVSAVAWSSEGDYLLSSSYDKTIRVYTNKAAKQSVDEFVELARPLIHGHALYDVKPISNRLIGAISDEKCIRLLEPTQCFANILGGKLVQEALPFAGMVPALLLTNKALNTPEAVSKEFSPLTADEFRFDGPPPAHNLWLTRWPETSALSGHDRELRKLAVSAEWFATGDDRGGVVIWDKSTLKARLQDLNATKTYVTGMDASPDGGMLIVCHQNGAVYIYDSHYGREMARFQVPSNEVCTSCAWSKSSEYFAVGAGSSIHIYERDGTLVHSSSLTPVTALAFVNTYELLAGFQDGSLMQYHYGAAQCKLTEIKLFTSHTKAVTSIAVHPTSLIFASSSADHSIAVHSL